ncbi:hypothetical protein KBZ15_06070 [Cyanobium sp. BA20m-p-22]|uniref:hypothetical protein n=1 Tax=Cyanobium sp. BA20m-p-22 TaxID=2823704 RepID=UPI0020CC7CED|nr:hypothetical protein [Cyanobium sp. BA20m-p-22]MCP9909478.1 hypothetical protein [Cyanobium sp. BA20m-p-22]
MAFCLSSSAIYRLNNYRDVAADRADSSNRYLPWEGLKLFCVTLGCMTWQIGWIGP